MWNVHPSICQQIVGITQSLQSIDWSTFFNDPVEHLPVLPSSIECCPQHSVIAYLAQQHSVTAIAGLLHQHPISASLAQQHWMLRQTRHCNNSSVEPYSSDWLGWDGECSIECCNLCIKASICNTLYYICQEIRTNCSIGCCVGLDTAMTGWEGECSIECCDFYVKASICNTLYYIYQEIRTNRSIGCCDRLDTVMTAE